MAGTEVQLTSNLADQFDPYIFGDKIVWEDWRNANNPEIFMYDLPSSTEIRITDNSWGQYAPAMSMDKIFWTDFRIGNNRRDIYMYDLNTNTESRIVDAPGNQQAVDTSDNRIVWKDDRNGFSDIYVYDLETQIETRLTNGSDDYVIYNAPSISGSKIVWQATSENWSWDYEIYVHDLVTSITSKVVAYSSYNQQLPSISGGKIVWQDNRNGNEDIYMYDLATQTETQITHNFYNQTLPKIFGDKIVWQDYRHGDSDVYAYDLTTHAESRITSDAAYNVTGLSISDDIVVWQDGRNGNSDIYMYEFDALPENIFPTAQISPVSMVTSGQLVSFDGSGSDDSDGTIVSYAWDFGDGSIGSGVIASHVYAAAGTYQVTLTVVDNHGATSTAGISVKVNAVPVAVIAPIQTVIIGEATRLDGSGSYGSDGMIVLYQWDFGDGSTGSSAIINHAYAVAGTYQATLMVTDDDNAAGIISRMAIVQTPIQALNDLIALVQSMNLARGISNSLDSKLQNASAALSAENANDREDAVNKLEAFINATQAQSGNQLTVEQASQLIAAAQRIISVL